jgi:hypothetical protein
VKRILLALLVVLAFPRLVHAAAGAIGSLGEAQSNFNAGDYYQTAELVAPLLEDESIARADRAEAFRLYGLSLYFLGKREQAEAMLLEFLKLEPDAHLNPALVPPDGIAFFEDVRSRHNGELARYRPQPKWKDRAIVSIIPLAGQLQNGDRAKGWAILTTEVLLLATNVTTYAVLRDICDEATKECEPEGTARVLKTVNIVSGIALIGVVAYGTIDGVLGYRRRHAEWEAIHTPQIGVEPASRGHGMTLTFTTSF